MAAILEVSNSNLSRQKRKLMRSMGSFSTVEENIIAPTPRKISQLGVSPKSQRREKRKNSEEKLFGEAGFELQSILLQSIEVLKEIPICCPAYMEKEEEIDNFFKSGKLNEVSAPPRASGNPLASPPLERAMNPVALNSPFVYSSAKVESTAKLDASQQLVQLQKRQLLTPGITSKLFKAPAPSHVSNTGKELSRNRSASWPSLPIKITKKPHLVKA